MNGLRAWKGQVLGERSDSERKENTRMVRVIVMECSGKRKLGDPGRAVKSPTRFG